MDRRATVGVLALLVGLPAHASAGDYRMVWNIDEPASGTVRSGVRPGTEIVRLRLLPPGLFRAAADIVNARGGVLVARGTQLVRMKSDVPIACTFSLQPKSGVERLLFAASLKRVCLVDSDGDGRFDASFLRATNGPAFFLLRGHLGDRLDPIAPVSLEGLDPHLIERGPRISLKLHPNSRVNRTTLIEGDVGNDSDPFPLAVRMRTKAGELPASFQAYGGSVRIAASADGTYVVATAGRFRAADLDFWD